MSTSRIAESFPKLEEWISTTASTGTLPMATSGEKASSLLLQKPFRCQKANCNKSFMTQNGLKYHTVYGICNFVPGRDLEDHKDSAERRSEKTASVSVGTSNESEGGPHQGALNRQQKGTGLVPTPPSNLDTPSQQHIPTQSSTTSETALSNDSTLSKISPQDLESSIEAERRLRPFACGVDDCQKRYKNIYGLKYHYQHTGEHGVVGLERLENGQHECLAIDKRRHDAISTSEEDQRGTRIGHADSTNAQHASEWIGARPIKGDVSVNHAHSASVATVRNDPSYRSEQLSVPLWMHTHDTVAYLDGVMLDLAKDEVTLKSFRSEFEKWSEARMPAFSGSWKNRDKSNRSIFRMAEILRFKPKLVQGLKNLLFPGQKLECFFNDKEVEYFIFVNTPSDIQIRCTLPDMALFPSSDCDIRFMANPSHTWKSTVLTNRGKDWVACVSRAIELMLENPSPDFPLQERHRVRELRDILITYLRYGELSINIGTSTKCTSIGLDAATAIIPATQPEQKAVEWKGSNSATPHNFPQDSYQLKMLGYDAQTVLTHAPGDSEGGRRPPTPLLFEPDDEVEDSIDAEGFRQPTALDVIQDSLQVQEDSPPQPLFPALFKSQGTVVDRLQESSPLSSISSGASLLQRLASTSNPRKDPTLRPNWRLAMSRQNRRPLDLMHGNLSSIVRQRRKAVVGSTSTASSNSTWPNFASVSDGSIPSL